MCRVICECGFVDGDWVHLENAQVLLGSLKLLSRWFVEGKLIVHVSHSYPLEGAPQAFQAILSRESVGKVLLTLEGAQPKL
jgi:NADPH-dependent curcumin reductase CurA